MSEQEWVRSGIGHSTPDTITVCGRDVANELMGRVSFTDLAFMLVMGREPTSGEGRVFDAVLVSLADHGLTPTVLAARLTYTGAPESLQGAVAAGLLGAGSVFLGPTADTAAFLHGVVAAEGLGAGDGGGDATDVAAAQSDGEPGEVSTAGDDADGDDAAYAAAAETAVRVLVDAGERVPGLGHPVHKVLDPRVPRLYELAAEAGTLGPHLRLLEAVRAASAAISGRQLPINGAGAAGAALADLGLPTEVIRGFSLLARTAGLVGHLAEEARQPLGMQLYREIDGRMVYEPPPAD